MKYIYVLFLLVFLASCGANTTTEEPTSTDNDVEAIVESTLDEFNAELDELDTDTNEEASESAPVEEVMEKEESTSEVVEEAEAENKVVMLQTKYTNPQTEVIMDIKYELDAEGKITSINVSSDNYDGLGDFNEAAQVVIGKTVKEASEASIAGSSLTTPAFQAALKDAQ